ncbi:hypothetical protein HMPREF9225_1604 [Peptoniphilus duerdenii ATCC BAA-1640]|uniref:Fimbrial assembly protein PilN n=1 Tax=Peptoniphilus duerdenii ATCC BAA-1640 TaxID=862517 RepID=E0NN65_9FIRM|nr:hypothetical protein [Peptoniphilus duerdenii]EFM24738.1 hypothetical protein HMPREF9225_1604 [Peptoniphilus duerdenii ATCC BAA-1640]
MQIVNIFLDENLIYLNYNENTTRIIVDESVLYNGRITDENYLLYILKKEIENREIKSGTDAYVYFMKSYIHKTLELPNLSEADLESMIQIESKEYFETDEQIIPMVEKFNDGKYSVSAIYLEEFEKVRKIFDKLDLNLRNVYPITTFVEENSDGAYVFVGRRSADIIIKNGSIEKIKNIDLNNLVTLKKDYDIDEKYFHEIKNPSFYRDSVDLQDFFMGYDFIVSEFLNDLKNIATNNNVSKIFLNDYFEFDQYFLEEQLGNFSVDRIDFSKVKTTTKKTNLKSFNFKKLGYILLCCVFLLFSFIIYRSKSDKLEINERKLESLKEELDSIDLENIKNENISEDSSENTNEKVDFSEKFEKILEKLKKLNENDILITSIKADEQKIVISGLAKDEPTIKIIEDYLKDYNPRIDYEKKDVYYFTINLEEK